MSLHSMNSESSPRSSTSCLLSLRRVICGVSGVRFFTVPRDDERLAANREAECGVADAKPKYKAGSDSARPEWKKTISKHFTDANAYFDNSNDRTRDPSENLRHAAHAWANEVGVDFFANFFNLSI